MHITVHLGIHLCPMPLVAFTGRAGDATAPFPQKLQGTRRQPGEVMERHPDSALPSTSLIMRDPGFPSSADCFVPDSPKGASPLTSRRQKRAHAYRGVAPGCSQQPGTKSHPTVLSSRRSNETTGFMAQKVSCAEMRTLQCIR